MKRTSTLGRMERLELISARLKEDGFCTARGLADELGISLRTLTRDIQILRDQGVPIEADRGRGGGLRLDRRWGIGRLSLSYAQAVDLLISLAITEQMQSPLFMAHLGAIKRKLMMSFSADTKSKIAGLKDRILTSKSASALLLADFKNPPREAVEKLHQGFLQMQEITISYRAESGAQTTRRIQPHYLLLSYPIWYVLAWDHLRGEVRTFRCDRITGIAAQEAEFRLRPLADFTAAIEGAQVI